VSGPLLTARQVGELLGISPRTVLAWTRRGELPAVKLPSGAVRYRPDELNRWLADRAVGADGADEECHLPDAPAARLQAYARPLRFDSSPTPEDEED
jgi:excisionase family DNA binding protein